MINIDEVIEKYPDYKFHILGLIDSSDDPLLEDFNNNKWSVFICTEDKMPEDLWIIMCQHYIELGWYCVYICVLESGETRVIYIPSKKLNDEFVKYIEDSAFDLISCKKVMKNCVNDISIDKLKIKKCINVISSKDIDGETKANLLFR